MRCLTLLILVVLIALLGLTSYNYVQIRRIERDLVEVKSRILASEQAAEEEGGLLTALASATEHALRSKDLLSKGEMKSARTELEKSLQKLETAAELSRSPAEAAKRNLDAAVSTAREELEKAWKEVSKQTSKRRPEGNGSVSEE